MTEVHMIPAPPTAVVPRKPPLAEAALILAEICDRIDEGVDLDHAMVTLFQDAKLELADAVDRRIAFDTWAKGAIEAARQAREQWDQRVQMLKAVHDRFKDNTKAIMEQRLDLPFQGKLGKLALQKNPPSLQLAFGDKAVTTDVIKFFGIAEEFVRTSYSIDTERVKGALKVGTEITWAALKTDGVHLRIRK